MERRSPFDHHRPHHRDIDNNRYVSLPPPPPLPRFPDDRHFSPHHNHRHFHLPPPPPLPLPLPPPLPHLHHSFQYFPDHHHNHHRFPIEDPPPRQQHFQPNHPNPRFHNQEHHYRHSKPLDYTLDTWDPPPLLLPPPPPPINDIRVIPWKDPNTRSPPRDSVNFHDYNRLDNDDIVSRSPGFLFGKSIDINDPKEEVLWAKNQIRVPEAGVSSNFTFGKGKVNDDGDKLALGENIVWGTADTKSKKMKGEERELGFERRGFSGRGFRNQLKIEEGVQEFGYSPKRKLQRTSVLLRVGKNSKKWNEEEEEGFRGKYVEESSDGGSFGRRGLGNYVEELNDGGSVGRRGSCKYVEELSDGGSFGRKQAIDFSEERVDQSRVETSAVDELDVIFKSNALVAKAVTSHCEVTPTKKRKIAPVFGVTSPRGTEVDEKLVSEDGSLGHLDSTLSSKKGLSYSKKLSSGDSPTKITDISSSSEKSSMHSESKGAITGIRTTSGVNSQPCSEKNTVSPKKSTKEITSVSTTVCSSKQSSRGDSRTHSAKVIQLKTNTAISGTGTGDSIGSQICLSTIGKIPLSSKKRSGKESLNEGSCTQVLDDASSSDKGLCLTQSKDKVFDAGNGSGDDVISQLCLNGTTKQISTYNVDSDNLLVKSGLSQQKLDDVLSFDDGLSLTQSKDKVPFAGHGSEDGNGFQNSLNGICVPVETSTTENSYLSATVCSSEKSLNGDSSIQKLDDATISDKGSTQLKDEVSVSVLGTRDGIIYQPCPKGADVPLEAAIIENTPLNNILRSGKELLDKAPSTHKLEFPLISGKGVIPSDDKGTASEMGGNANATSPHLCLNGVSLPLEISVTEKAPLSSMGSDVLCSPTIKKNRKKKNKFDVYDSGLPAPATIVSVPVSVLPALASEAKTPASGMKIGDATASQPFLDKVTVPLGHMVVSDVTCAAKTKKRKKQKKKKISLPNSCVATPAIKENVPVIVTSDAVSISLEERNNMQPNMSIDYEKVNPSSENALMPCEEKFAVSGTGPMVSLGLQPLHGMNISIENNAEVKLLSSPASGSAGACKKKKNRKIKFMDHCLEVTRPTVTEVHEKPVSGDISMQSPDYDLNSVKGQKQSEVQATVSGTKRIENLGVQSLGKVSVSHEKSAAVKPFISPVIDSSEVSIIQKKNVFERLSGLPRSGGTEIYKDPRSSDTINYCENASLNSDKDLTKVEENSALSSNGVVDDINIQSLHAVTALPGNRVSVEAHEHPVAAPANTTKDKKKIKKIVKVIKKIVKVKKKRKLMSSISSLRSSPGTGICDELKNSVSCNKDVEKTDSLSDKGQKKSKEGVIFCGTGSLDGISSQSLHAYPLSLKNSLEERLPINMVSVGNIVDKDSEHPNTVSSSSADDSTFPNGHASLSIDLGGAIIESENGGREGDIDAVGYLDNLGKEKDEDIAMYSLVQDKYDSLALEFQVSAINEKPMSKSTENDIYALSVKAADSSSISPCASPGEEAPSTSIMNSDEGRVESAHERESSIDDQRPRLSVQAFHMLKSQGLQCHLSSKNCREHEPTSDPEGNTSLDEPAVAEGITPKMTQLLPSLQNQQPKSTLRSKVEDVIGRKSWQSPLIPKVLPGKASFSPAHNKSNDSPTQIVKPRTWHRTGNPTLPQKVSSLNTSHSQRQAVKKIQSTSYIRKGNSLVRNSASTATTTKVLGGVSTLKSQLNHVGRDGLSSVSEQNFNCLDPQIVLKKGLERSKLPQMPNNVKLPIGVTKSPQVTTFPCYLPEAGSRTTPDPLYKPASNHAGASENQNCVSQDSEAQGLIDSGKLQSSKMKAVMYVKSKSNQLVASSGTETHGCSSTEVYDCSSPAESSQSLPSSTPYDQYYKKNKNQLIRNVPSLSNHLKQAVVTPDDSSNLENQRASKASSFKCSRNTNKRKLDKASVKARKLLKFSLVWTLHGTKTQNEDTGLLQRRKVYPYILPWKRTTQWRNSKLNFVSSKSSFSRISKKLLLSRNRNAVYTRSTGGFSLRKSKILSIGGSNLKWSKSIEQRSKKANEEATLAVAEVERKKREKKDAGSVVPSAKRRNQSSRARIFRVGSVRYRMDASKLTLQRIPDESASCTIDHQSGKDTRKSFIPKRLLIDNDEYIRIGNGNKLVRDPKKLVRRLANEKVRWSLHTARLRLARKQQYCQFFTRFGKCNRDEGKCPYIHDPAKIAVCTKFLKGLCSNTSCKLTHKVIPERMEDCSYFLQGLCTNESCPYRHVNVNPNASVCEGFLRGYCANGDECRKKHSYVCPAFKSTGVCPQRTICKLHHPKGRNQTKKLSDSKNIRVRYFGSELNGSGKRRKISSDKYSEKKSGDIFTSDGGLVDYIGLDASDEEEQDANAPIDKSTLFCDVDRSDLQSDELDELVKPMRLIKKNLS